jgi:hypothetical protein
MEDRIRIRHDVGKSARDFTNEHPSEIEGHTATALELNRAVDRMDEQVGVFEQGHRDAAAATEERDRLIDLIFAEYLRPIAAISRGNAELDPATARRFRAPARDAAQGEFLGAARSVAALAEEQKAVFVRDGMPASFVADLTQALDDYEAAATKGNNARQLHVGARAELGTLARQVMQLLRRLDGINRYRYRNDPHLYAQWQAARNAAWPERVKGEGKAQPAA